MTKETPKTGSWTTIRQQLATLEQPALLALVKELYQAAPGNRDFLHARYPPLGGGEEALEAYRRKIVEQFFPARGFGKLKLAEARKAIRDYGKATGHLAGIVELMMTYVENGARFTQEYGDIDERFYISVESVLDELAALLLGEARALYPEFQHRLAHVKQMSGGIGWGFGDHVAEVVDELKAELGGGA
ncbi:hypothetical protein [Polaromonas hydrogenivorans]|uniref:RsbT co-antagonist protein RsbRD N-terminal domain-containing protein n=1 Tax=Polaromonas hydrogenivorans TaxID=335476 RepID=A0AAU7LV96_9BURK